MALDLENELARLCREERPPLRLAEKLADTAKAANDIWEREWLYWFTDHSSATHSVRIIRLLGQALEHIQKSPSRLTRHELFVLLAACYLHDIGMQDFRQNGIPVEKFTPDTYDLVRKAHPARAAELIVELVISRTDSDFYYPSHETYIWSRLLLSRRGMAAPTTRQRLPNSTVIRRAPVAGNCAGPYLRPCS